jgi:uncharacterized membrane protein
MLGPVALLFVGGVLLVETSHHLMVKATEGPAMRVLWISYDATSPAIWAAIVALLVVGTLALRRMGPKVSDAFHSARLEALRIEVTS